MADNKLETEERSVVFLPAEKSIVLNCYTKELAPRTLRADLSTMPRLLECRPDLELYDTFRLSYSRNVATVKIRGEWCNYPLFEPANLAQQPFYFPYSFVIGLAASDQRAVYCVSKASPERGFRDMYSCGADTCPTAVLLVNAINNEQLSSSILQVLSSAGQRAARMLNVAANAAADQAHLDQVRDLADQAQLVHAGLPAFVETLQLQLRSC